MDIEFRKQYAAEDKLIITNAGKQYEGKHILFVVEIVRKLQLRGVKLLLILVGTASDEYNRKIVEKLGSLSSGSWLVSFMTRLEQRRFIVPLISAYGQASHQIQYKRLWVVELL